jgi:hypothetical protein
MMEIRILTDRDLMSCVGLSID